MSQAQKAENLTIEIFYEKKPLYVTSNDEDATFDFDDLNIPTDIQLEIPKYVKGEAYEEDEPQMALYAKSEFLNYLQLVKKPKVIKQQKIRNIKWSEKIICHIKRIEKFFNIGGFRGLDTENPKDKVESFRATNGKNFQIDSNSLKTRPGLINDKVYNVDGNIIGMFVWNGLEILLTVGDINGKSRIYVINDNFSYYTDGLDSNVRKIFSLISVIFLLI